MNISYIKSAELVPYLTALNFMEQRVNDIILKRQKQTIWFLEHPHIFTGGASAVEAEMLDPVLPVYHTNRGGKYSYHGPGQRIVYLMMDLNLLYGHKPNIKDFISKIEDWVINSLKIFNIHGEKKSNRIGIWVETKSGEKKIAAIGVRVKKWVTYHGIAINVMPDLKYFEKIIPCGIKEYGVTSMYKLGFERSLEDFDQILLKEFINLFNCALYNENCNL